jgi:hypothetical protein
VDGGVAGLDRFTLAVIGVETGGETGTERATSAGFSVKPSLAMRHVTQTRSSVPCAPLEQSYFPTAHHEILYIRKRNGGLTGENPAQPRPIRSHTTPLRQFALPDTQLGGTWNTVAWAETAQNVCRKRHTSCPAWDHRVTWATRTWGSIGPLAQRSPRKLVTLMVRGICAGFWDRSVGFRPLLIVHRSHGTLRLDLLMARTFSSTILSRAGGFSCFEVE